ncbi:DNA starvation/stationary phase protection protein [Aliiroseovarius sp. S1339]|uniref:Dps family protein n=1 Tax=Aliiroseovarius sp. S1339 TaxID=2936990 RepID=UPI0020BE3039|nr:DNA starvation/stationary phase protection protein [Aliiroseovarius sp. S1339]MCK8462909.1 DNA starvation/stationary phase protection protein [Aliiroseovarius sp. S1339]
MTTTLKQTAMTDTPKPDIRNAKPVVDALAEVLNDTYALIIKTHTYHWNVTGPLFFAVHSLTEEQYDEMFAAADVIAERIRALGQLASVKVSDTDKSANEALSAVQMINDLLADHETLTERARALVEIAEAENDPATADLATERAAFHEKTAWMLRSLAA